MNGNPYLDLETLSGRDAEGRAGPAPTGVQSDGDGVAAFLCDEQAHVRSRTPDAQRLFEADGPLALRNGVLSARTGEADLGGVIRLVAAAPVASLASRTLIISAGPGEILVLDFTALTGEPGTLKQVLVTVRNRVAAAGDHETVLRDSFGLTAAEAVIAIRLGRGATRESIARERGVSLGTIKSQIKSVYQKVGVTREVELAACLASLS